MSATPPEAGTEYSRGDRGPGGRQPVPPDDSPAASGNPEAASYGPAFRAALLAGGLLGVLLLAGAEFTPLLDVRTSSGPIKSVATGSHHSYALLLLAALSAVLAFAVFRDRNRAAALAIGAVGVVALLIALIGDLPDAEATGLVGSSKTHFVQASSQPRAGLYLETLGAVVLLISSGVGWLLLAPAGSVSRRPDR